MKKKIVFLPYDFDTAIGINNEGTLEFSYNLEDTDKTDGDADVFNGQQSVLWNNVRECFFDEIKTMYQTLRSSGDLSYSDTEQRFEEHQAKWAESIFNEDSYFKYLAPLIDDNTAAYLSMLQGSKAEQRKWWLYNRFRYIDSKYNAGDSLTDVITLRGYEKDSITVVPYADIYPTVKYGSYLVQDRGKRNESCTLACPLDSLNDTEIYIYSASQLKSIGDLSGLKVGYAEFSYGTHLQELKIGDESESYTNERLTSLTLGNNTLLKKLDVRNCTNLVQPVDISGCSNIEEVYFDGTGITGLQIPNGGILKILHLPETITNLTIRNQPSLSEFVMPSYQNISTLRIENAGTAIDAISILKEIQSGSRVRILGLDITVESSDEIKEFFDTLDTMRGLDENGNNLDNAQVQGTIFIDTITGSDYAALATRYPYVTITYNHIASVVYFYDETGTTLITQANSVDNAAVKYTGSTPTKASTAQYSYSFSGWSTTSGGAAVSDALTNITGDKKLYAAFTSSVRKYTIRFYNESTLLESLTISYGSTPAYSGATPTYVGDDPDNYGDFVGWNPSITSVTGDKSYYATFEYVGSVTVALVERTIKSYSSDITSVGHFAFNYCTTLTSVNLPNVTDLYGYAFAYCKGLTSVTLPKAVNIGNYAFYYCTGLTSAELPEATTIGNSVFDGCLSLASVELQSVTSVGSYAFQNCSKLTFIELPNITIVGNYAFNRCSSLTSVELPNVTSVGSYAFQECSKLTSIDLQNAKSIAAYAFSSCTNLASISLPSVTNIVNGALRNCTNLTSLTIGTADSTTVCTYGTVSSDYDPSNADLKIYVAPALVDSYKTADNWSRLADKIYAIGE